MMIVNLISPDDRYDGIFLSNYATIYIKRRIGPAARRGRHHLSRPARLQPAGLARSRQAGRAEPERHADVVTAIAQQNLQVAAGQIGQQPVPKGQQFQLTINTLGRLTDPEQFADIILKAGRQYRRGPSSRSAAGSTTSRPDDRQRRSRLSSDDRHRRRRPPASSACATWPASSWARSSTTSPARSTASPSVALSIFQLPGSNALETAAGVYAKMKELKTRFPDGLDYQIVYDTTPFIRESVNEVFYTLRDAVILVAAGGAGLPAELAGGHRFRWWPCRWPSSAHSPSWPPWAIR